MPPTEVRRLSIQRLLAGAVAVLLLHHTSIWASQAAVSPAHFSPYPAKEGKITQVSPPSPPSAGSTGQRRLDSYREGLAGSWMMVDDKNGLLFDNRHLILSLMQVSVAAGVASLTAKLPGMVGFTGAFPTFLGRLAVFLMPAYVFKSHWDKEDNWQINRIAIADNPALAELLSIELLRGFQGQKLIFRLPPQQLAGMNTDTLKDASPFSQLIKTMALSGSDYLEIQWTGSKKPLRIITGGHRQSSIAALSPMTGNQSDTSPQQLPAILSVLQPDALSTINAMLHCINTRQSGRELCPEGTLQLNGSSGIFNLYQYRPVASEKAFKAVSGKILGNRFLVPLPPCHERLTCSMAMAWNIGGLNLPVTDFIPPSHEPLLLYTKPVKLLDLSRRYTSGSSLIIRTIPAWATDLLSMAPYVGVYLLTDYLLSKGMNSYGIASTSVLTGGLSAWGLAAADDSSLGYTPDQGGGFGFWPFYGGNDDDNRKLLLQPVSASQMEQQMLQAMKSVGGNKVIGSELFVEELTDEPTLSHIGNNCFFNSSLAFLAHTLQPEELDAIANDRYLSKARKQLLALDDDLNDAYINIREKFIGLMRAMQPDEFTELSKKKRDALQRGLYNGIKAFISASPGDYPGLEEVLVPRRMNSLNQEDAHELLIGLLDIFQFQLNPAASVVLADRKEVHFNGEIGAKNHIDKKVRFNILHVSLPGEKKIKAQKINNIDRLLNNHVLGKEWVHEQSNLLQVTPEDAMEMGLSDIFETRRVPFYMQTFLAHENGCKLKHLNLQFKLFNYGINGQKIRTVSRRLLAGDGSISVPVDNFAQSRQAKIRMEPDAMILHKGSRLNSGHYMVAVKRDNEWFIYDDMASNVVRLSSNGRIWGHSPMKVLSSYLEAHNLDPYIIHYHR